MFHGRVRHRGTGQRGEEGGGRGSGESWLTNAVVRCCCFLLFLLLLFLLFVAVVVFLLLLFLLF